MQRELTSLEALETRGDDYDGDDNENVAVTITGSNREAGHLPSALAPYCVADPRKSTMTESVSGTEYQGLRAPGIAAPATGTGTPVAGVQYSRAQLGQVQVVRRRVSRSGRMELKLVLLGTTVDRCVVCKMRFLDNDNAALGTRCQHA
jgi:hypothetical protein